MKKIVSTVFILIFLISLCSCQSELLSIDSMENYLDPEIYKVHTVILSEEYEIRIYGTYAHVYYGYASIGEKKDAYYTFTDITNENINAYILNKGV